MIFLKKKKCFKKSKNKLSKKVAQSNINKFNRTYPKGQKYSNENDDLKKGKWIKRMAKNLEKNMSRGYESST